MTTHRNSVVSTLPAIGGSAIRWWESVRPAGWTLEQHLVEPTEGLAPDQHELATQVATWLRQAGTEVLEELSARDAYFCAGGDKPNRERDAAWYWQEAAKLWRQRYREFGEGIAALDELRERIVVDQAILQTGCEDIAIHEKIIAGFDAARSLAEDALAETQKRASDAIEVANGAAQAAHAELLELERTLEAAHRAAAAAREELAALEEKAKTLIGQIDVAEGRGKYDFFTGELVPDPLVMTANAEPESDLVADLDSIESNSVWLTDPNPTIADPEILYLTAWSEADQGFVGTCSAFPALVFLGNDHDIAKAGIVAMVKAALGDAEEIKDATETDGSSDGETTLDGETADHQEYVSNG